jgi:hypothetical protein
VRKRPDIGSLDDVLGLAVIAQDAAGKPEKPAVVGFQDGANRGFVPVKRTPDEFGVARGGGGGVRGASDCRMMASLSVEQ